MMAKHRLQRRLFSGWMGMAMLAMLASCTTPTTSASTTRATALPPYLPDWDAYEIADDASFDLTGIEGELTPVSLAKALWTEPDTWECFQVSQVRVESLVDGMMAVLATRVGLCDDSVAAMEERIDLVSTPTGWMLDQVGQRYGCARPEFRWAEPGTLCP